MAGCARKITENEGRSGRSVAWRSGCVGAAGRGRVVAWPGLAAVALVSYVYEMDGKRRRDPYVNSSRADVTELAATSLPLLCST